jgi:hypothetical protein
MTGGVDWRRDRGPGRAGASAAAGRVDEGSVALPPRFYRFDDSEVEVAATSDELWPLDSLLLSRPRPRLG